jgi:hypothetical protein
MRWNCPHCETLVTAGIDFENTKKAYVRCAKCQGMALIHRSAVLADYVKARRLEEEAQLEIELRLTQTATANSRMQAMESQIRGLNEKITETARSAATAVKAPSLETAPGLGMEVEKIRSATPPPFHPSFEMLEEGSTQSPIDDTAIAPPVFNYGNPPAFLLKPETIERSFAVDEEIDEEVDDGSDPKTERSIAIGPSTLASLRPILAFWIAAGIAVASGTYLYTQGRKAFAPSAAVAPSISASDASSVDQADEIQSEANSALRAETRPLVIVRVSRAELRTGPSTATEAIQSLDRASIAKIIAEQDGWMKIESPKISTADHTAWIRGDLVTRIPN